jgi:hypothetical protein
MRSAMRGIVAQGAGLVPMSRGFGFCLGTLARVSAKVCVEYAALGNERLMCSEAVPTCPGFEGVVIRCRQS